MNRIPKRGPQPKRESRQETFRDSSKKHRTDLLASGKVEFKSFIEPATKEALLSIKKQQPDLKTLGQVIDYLVKQTQSQQ